MKTFHKTLAAGLVALGLTAASMVSVSAAPQLDLTGLICTVTKESGSKYHLVVTGSYDAASASSVDYKINAFRLAVWNNGGQQYRDSGRVEIAPTAFYSITWDEYISYKSAASIRNAEFWVWNGGSLKGQKSRPCSKNF